MWNKSVCDFFFHYGSSESESDAFFCENYCSEQTRQNLRKNGIPPSYLRKVLSRLLPMIPDVENSTPPWTSDVPAQLLVCIGRAQLQYRRTNRSSESFRPVPVIRQPRFGLCAIDRQIHMWTDSKFGCDATLEKSPYAGFHPEHWVRWPGRQGKCYFKLPLPADESNAQLDDPLKAGQPLWSFVQEICGKLKDRNFLLDQAFAPIRARLGVPEEYSVIYPRLLNENNRFAIREHKKIGNGTLKVQAKDLEREGDKLPPLSNIEKILDTATLQVELDALVDRLQLGEIPDAKLVDAPNVTGRFYVYVLLDPHSKIPFYVGKGVFDRALQHFKPLKFGDNSNDGAEEFAVTSLVLGADPDHILTAEREPLVQSGTDDAGAELAAEKNKIARIQEILTDKNIHPSDIPRVVGRCLSEQGALAIESLMIKSVYGIDQLTNVVSGHHENRFRTVGNWDYLDSYDLPTTDGMELHADAVQHQYGAYYVYILRHPQTGKIFYVGKGKGDRLCQHFTNARDPHQFQGVPRLQQLNSLLNQGFTPKQIGRIVARVDSEAMAYVIESFYIKFVVGFSHLMNVQPGHLSGMFRAIGDWEVRAGFDLPTSAGGMRKLLQDLFLGEGLDSVLHEVVCHADLKPRLSSLIGPKLIGAGELAYLAEINGVNKSILLRIQIRSARRIQVGLHPIGKKGNQWMQTNFGKFGLYPLDRQDDIFTPKCWRGAANVAIEIDLAVNRAVRLIGLAQALQNGKELADIVAFDDLLSGLPR